MVEDKCEEVIKKRPLINRERKPSDDVEDNIIYTDLRWWVDPTYALGCMQYITVPRACSKG